MTNVSVLLAISALAGVGWHERARSARSARRSTLGPAQRFGFSGTVVGRPQFPLQFPAGL